MKKTLTINDFKVGQRVRYRFGENPRLAHLNGDGVVAEVNRASCTVKVDRDDGTTFLYSALENFEILEQPEPEDKAKLPDLCGYVTKVFSKASDEFLAREYRYGTARQNFLRKELEKRGYKVSIRRGNPVVTHLPKASPISHVYLKKTVTEEIEL